MSTPKVEKPLIGIAGAPERPASSTSLFHRGINHITSHDLSKLLSALSSNITDQGIAMDTLSNLVNQFKKGDSILVHQNIVNTGLLAAILTWQKENILEKRGEIEREGIIKIGHSDDAKEMETYLDDVKMNLAEKEEVVPFLLDTEAATIECLLNTEEDSNTEGLTVEIKSALKKGIKVVLWTTPNDEPRIIGDDLLESDDFEKITATTDEMIEMIENAQNK